MQTHQEAKWGDRFLPLLGLGIGLILWWAGTRGGSLLERSFTPAETGKAFYNLISTGEIWPHLVASLKRITIGLSLAALIGFPLGLLQGVAPRFEKTTSVLFQFIRMISPLAWMPMAVMVLGVGNAPVIFLLTIAAVWPLIIGTTAGVHAVDPENLTLARSLCATKPEILFHIIIPSIIPHLLTGLRLAMGVAWIVLVPAEMLGVQAGLGYFILDTRDRLAYSELLAVLLIIGIIGTLFDATLRLVNRSFTASDS